MKQEYHVPIILTLLIQYKSLVVWELHPGGNREYVPGLIRAAVVQVDGVFLECHHDSDNAPSDGPNMVKMNI